MAILSNSEISTFKRCRKKWYYAYKEKLKPKIPDAKLMFGNGIHIALAEYYQKYFLFKNVKGDGQNLLLNSFKTWAKNEFKKICLNSNNDPTIVEQTKNLIKKGLKLLKAYYDFSIMNDNFKILKAEKRIELPIMKNLIFAAKADALIKDDNGLWLMEHKTTSTLDYSSKNLVLDEQATRYLWAFSEYYKKDINGVLYNFLCKTKTPKFKREKVYRTPEFLKEIKSQLLLEFEDMRKPNIYRSPDISCNWSCEFKELCVAELDKSDVEYLKDSLYEKK